MAIRRLIATGALSAVLLGGLAATPPAPAQADEQGVLLFTVPSSAAAAIDDLDVVGASDAGLIVLGDTQTEATLTERGVAVLDTESYENAISGQPQSRVAAFAAPLAAPEATTAAGYPLPDRLAQETYDTFFGGYRTVDSYDKFARDIAAQYPELVQLVKFGESWEKTEHKGGSDLLAVRITQGVAAQPDWANGQEGRPRFVLVAQAHAREIVTSEIAWRYATELLNGYGTDPQITALLDSTEVWINFQNNPDGARLVEKALSVPGLQLTPKGDGNPPVTSQAWQRKNTNSSLFNPTSTNWSNQHPGVDLNRNWAYKWGGASTSTNPNLATYLGTSPASEPETRELSKLLTKLFGTSVTESEHVAPADRKGTYLNIHAYSDYVIYPYAYDKGAAVPNLEAIKANAFRQSFGSDFQTGKAGEILYDNAGNDIDWVYSQLGVPAFTYEIGTSQMGGFFPSYERATPFWDRAAHGIRFAAEAAYEPYTAALGGVISEVSAERGADGQITVTGIADDNAYGTNAKSASRRPAVTPISEVEIALAADRNSIGDTQTLSFEHPTELAEPTPDVVGSTVNFSGTVVVDRSNAAANSVFARAKNGSGQWGPWEAARAAAIAAPTFAGDTSFAFAQGAAQRIALSADSVIAPEFSVAAGALPSGLTLDSATGVISGTASEAGTREATVRIDNGAGHFDVALSFAVSAAPGTKPQPGTDTGAGSGHTADVAATGSQLAGIVGIAAAAALLLGAGAVLLARRARTRAVSVDSAEGL